MLVLLILVIIGGSATTNTTVGLQIAGNDRVTKKTLESITAVRPRQVMPA